MSKMTVTDHRRIFDDVTKSMYGFRQDMFRNIDYLDGIQYTTEDVKYLTAQKRLPIVWNMILPQILAFVSAEKANRTYTHVVPVENSDAKMASILSYLLDQDNDETDATWEISRAAVHAAIFRYGALMGSWEPTQLHPDGGWRVRSLDPRDVWWDYHPSEPDFDKSEYILYSRWFTPEHAINRFVRDEARRKELRAKAKAMIGVDDLKVPFSARYSSSNSWMVRRDKDNSTGSMYTATGRFTYSDYQDRGMFRIIELHERREHTYRYIFDYNTGEHIPIPDDKADDRQFIQNALAIRGLQNDERTIQSFHDYQMWQSVSAPDLDNQLLFEKPYPVQGRGFAIKIIPGYNFDPDRTRLRSIVDHLIDPQDLINRALSSRAHLMNKILNPDIYLGPNAIDDEKDLQALKSQVPGKIVHMTDLNHLRIEHPNLSGANLFTQEANEAMRLMEEAPGLNKAMKGVRESDDSGALVTKRAAFSEAMLTPFWDNISKAIKQLEEYHLGNIQYFMTQKRMLRVLQPNGTWQEYGYVNEYDALTNSFKNDVTVGRYDVKMDASRQTKSEKQQNLDKLFSLYMQSDPESRVTMQPLVLELINLPQSEDLVKSAKLLSFRNQLRTAMEISQLQQALTQGEAQNLLMPQQTQLQVDSMKLQAEQIDLNMVMTLLQKIQAQMQLQQMTAAMQGGMGAGPPQGPPGAQQVVDSVQPNPPQAM